MSSSTSWPQAIAKLGTRVKSWNRISIGVEVFWIDGGRTAFLCPEGVLRWAKEHPWSDSQTRQLEREAKIRGTVRCCSRQASNLCVRPIGSAV